MLRGGRSGNRRDPQGGWPLDRVLVGVGTLRTMRQLFHRQRGPEADPLRAWDVALHTSVSVPGATDSLERLEREGLVEVLPPKGPGGASRYRLDALHPLHGRLNQLFQAERRLVPRRRIFASRDRR